MFEGSRALTILKIELLSLKLRGYAPRGAVPELFFEDSPSCVRRSCAGGTCSNCALIQFVPAERRYEEPACRCIPLDHNGVTLDLLYKYGDSRETEEAVGNWLENTINRLENEKFLSASPKSPLVSITLQKNS